MEFADFVKRITSVVQGLILGLPLVLHGKGCFTFYQQQCQATDLLYFRGVCDRNMDILGVAWTWKCVEYDPLSPVPIVFIILQPYTEVKTLEDTRKEITRQPKRLKKIR